MQSTLAAQGDDGGIGSLARLAIDWHNPTLPRYDLALARAELPIPPELLGVRHRITAQSRGIPRLVAGTTSNPALSPLGRFRT